MITIDELEDFIKQIEAESCGAWFVYIEFKNHMMRLGLSENLDEEINYIKERGGLIFPLRLSLLPNRTCGLALTVASKIAKEEVPTVVTENMTIDELRKKCKKAIERANRVIPIAEIVSNSTDLLAYIRMSILDIIDSPEGYCFCVPDEIAKETEINQHDPQIIKILKTFGKTTVEYDEKLHNTIGKIQTKIKTPEEFENILMIGKAII